jgi:hypothetical protein
MNSFVSRLTLNKPDKSFTCWPNLIVFFDMNKVDDFESFFEMKKYLVFFFKDPKDEIRRKQL